MNFNMKRPCNNCPFRHDVKPFLRRERIRDILDGIIEQQQTFVCHKTLESDDVEDDEYRILPTSEYCAGAMIFLEKMGRPNQLMRIAGRLGLYDFMKLDMESPVYTSAVAMVRAGEK